MAGSKLPPQAYTRDILAHAYEWLKSQPASVKDMASSADNLVSLYLQSKRRMENGVKSYDFSSEDNTKSKASFKNDLKNLSEGLKQFEDPPAEKPTAASPGVELKENDPSENYNSIIPPLNTQGAELTTSGPQAESTSYVPGPTTAQVPQNFAKSQQPPPQILTNPQPSASNQPSQQHIHAQPQVQVVVQQPGINEDSRNHPNHQPPHSGPPIDHKTQAYLSDVKNRLNLSSEKEALRLLVAVGYDKLTQILPSND